MTLIRKPAELIIQPKMKVLIYGQPGIGKSSLALSSPSPLLFDFDGGIQRVNYGFIKDTVQIERYQDMLDVINGEDLSAYETLIIDTGGKCLDRMAEHIIKNNPRLGKANGVLTLQGFGERKAEFTALCKLIASKNKHIIFVAHRQTVQDGDDMRYVPLFGGSNYDSLVTELDLVGYMEANGKKRTITFDPSSRNDGKNTCNMPSVMDIPTLIDKDGNITGKNDFISEKVIKPYLDNLNERIEEGRKYSALMQSITDEIDLITDAQSANSFIDRINNFDHVGSSKMMAAKLLRDKASKLGLTLDKETKRYA